MDLIELKIKGISYSQTQTGAYALVLEEVNGRRTLPIIIGAAEAQSISISLEKDITPSRPLTHDLFKNFAESFEIKITKIVIEKLVDGVFFSNIICEGLNGNKKTIDSRTSDAIALAIRFGVSIYTQEKILERAGIHLKISDADDIIGMRPSNSISDNKNLNILSDLNEEALENKLKKALNEENYELAAEIRDEISKR